MPSSEPESEHSGQDGCRDDGPYDSLFVGLHGPRDRSNSVHSLAIAVRHRQVGRLRTLLLEHRQRTAELIHFSVSESFQPAIRATGRVIDDECLQSAEVVGNQFRCRIVIQEVDLITGESVLVHECDCYQVYGKAFYRYQRKTSAFIDEASGLLINGS